MQYYYWCRIRESRYGSPLFLHALDLTHLPFDSPLYSYILWYANGCYEIEAVQGTVTTKLKGVDRTNGTGIFENAGERIWDEADYVIPPQVGGVCVSQCEHALVQMYYIGLV